MKDRGTFAIINIDNYLHNLNFIKNHTRVDVMPVLKADGYGHGKEMLALEAEKSGYKRFAVAFLSEAVELLEAGLRSEILVLNYFDPSDLEEIYNYAPYIIPTISSAEFLKGCIDIMGKKIKDFKFDIKYNTGMSRVGLNDHEIDEVIDLIKKYEINIEGLYSHFATADAMDNFVHEQYRQYMKMVQHFHDKGIDIKIRHIDNSAGALLFPEYALDMVRAGIASYGLQPSDERPIKDLRPILELKSIISKVNMIKAGTSIGYGRTYVAKEDMLIASVPIGYADGYIRDFSNKAQVLIKGTRCSLLGRVSMDQIVVDISNLKDVEIGEEVVLIGKQGSEEITVEELAKIANTINYEITSLITKRVKRVYIRGGRLI